jgi:hypothetical protein
MYYLSIKNVLNTFMAQIRLTKTAEIEKILEYLKLKWIAMDEVEILKMAISKFYQEELAQDFPIEYLSEENSKGLKISKEEIKQGLGTKYDSDGFIKAVMED